MKYEKNVFYFRGKNSSTLEWVEGFQSYKFEGGERFPLIVHGAKVKATICDVVFPNSIQIYTNYNDIKDTKIFEGSILVTSHPDVPYAFVEFTGGCFAVQSFDRSHGYFLSSFLKKYKAVVIGNLFDAPEFNDRIEEKFPCVKDLKVNLCGSEYIFEKGKVYDGFVFLKDEVRKATSIGDTTIGDEAVIPRTDFNECFVREDGSSLNEQSEKEFLAELEKLNAIKKGIEDDES